MEIADAGIKDLLRLAQTFGFHLARLDLREESTRHEAAVADVLVALGRDESLGRLDDVLSE